MQITLVQSEIEEALSDFVLARMTIKDGMELKIDLAATRGTSGFTANVDIVPKVEPTLEVAKKVTAARKTKAEPVPAPAVVETTKAEQVVEQPVEAAIAEDEAAALAADAMDVNQPIPEVADEPAADGEAAPVAEEAPAPKTSLFGGLSRPVNTKAE